MKRILTVVLLLITISAAGAETTWISTDKSAYIAGERLWCSLSCIDGESYSDFSKVAYMELLGEGGAETSPAKVSLKGGRGSGYIDIPVDLPTGNYLLVAYTLTNGSVPTYRVVSIYNTLTSLKSGNCEILPAPDYSPYMVSTSALNASFKDGALIVDNSGEPFKASVSLFWEDKLQQGASLAGTLEPLNIGGGGEYEGEIINLAFSSDKGTEPFAGKNATISFIGMDKYIYMARIDSAGRASFVTGNIFSQRNMVCEVEDLQSDLDWSIDIVQTSPLKNVPFSSIVPKLYLDSKYADVLAARSLSMQTHIFFDKEQMYDEHTGNLRHNVFSLAPDDVYRLDDYKRFVTMKETFTEIIPSIITRRVNHKDVIKIELRDAYGASGPSVFGNVFVIVDGVPVLDNQKIFDLDPALVETIELFKHPISFGRTVAEGIMSIKTFKGDMGGMKFDPNVKVLSFYGCCPPVDARMSVAPDPVEYPDLRSTIYWNSDASLSKGANEFKVVLPMYKGVAFRLVVDGFNGKERIFYTKELHF